VIDPTKWNQQTEKAKGNSEEARNLNTYLHTLKNKVYGYQQSILQEGKVFTADALRMKWFGIDERSYSLIEIFQLVQNIIEAYKDHPECIKEDCLLPVPSNVKLNAYLEEIADLCGITKLLTFHIARHTFATTVTLTNGVPIETVSKMLGHKSIEITQIYAKIIDRKVSDDMNALRLKYAAKADDSLKAAN
jgi:integrase